MCFTPLEEQPSQKDVESRLFVGRNRLSDCHLQENTVGIFWEETVKDFKEAAQWASYCLVLRRLEEGGRRGGGLSRACLKACFLACGKKHRDIFWRKKSQHAKFQRIPSNLKNRIKIRLSLTEPFNCSRLDLTCPYFKTKYKHFLLLCDTHLRGGNGEDCAEIMWLRWEGEWRNIAFTLFKAEAPENIIHYLAKHPSTSQ